MSWADDLQQRAKQTLPEAIFDFIAGGADDESAILRNQHVLTQIKLIPRVLRDVSKIDTSLTLGKTKLSWPLCIAPTAPHCLVHEDGELAVAAAARKTNTLMIVSCMASHRLETIAESRNGSLWFQLHIFHDREVTKHLVQRAIKAGYEALVVTVDMPVMGNRRRCLKNRFKIPDHCIAANLLDEKLIKLSDNTSPFTSQHSNTLFDATVTWEEIKWLQSFCPLPIFLKGILHSEDAKIALQHNVAGIIVSNHGGRQLGAAPAPLEMLPSIMNIVQDKIPLLVDGGIRSGLDIVKALAYGAKAVLLGRPIFWGLAQGGEIGVSGVLSQLQRELVQAMTLCGFPVLTQINRSCSIF